MIKRLIPILALLCLTIPSNAAIAIAGHSYISQSVGCTNGSDHPTCTFSDTLLSTGNTGIFIISFCGSSACTTTPSSVSASDGTNTWSEVSAASLTLSNYNKFVFVANSVTSGTRAVTVTVGSGNFYYSQIEEIELSGTNNTAPIDSAVSAATFGTSTNPSITSSGNVSNAGEIAIVSFNSASGSTITNSGSYTTLDSSSVDSSIQVYLLSPSSGSTTTAAFTVSPSSTWQTVMFAIKPSSGGGGVVRRRGAVIQ